MTKQKKLGLPKRKGKRVLLKYRHYGYPRLLQLGIVIKAYPSHLIIKWDCKTEVWPFGDKSSEDDRRVVFLPEWLYQLLSWLPL